MENKTNAIYRGILDAANEAGRDAAARCVPTPMGVYQSDLEGNQLGPIEIVADGVCGFAWVHFKGNTAFARWAKKEAGARADYPSGMSLWVGGYNQSMQKKEAHAEAMAKVLNDNGISCCARSRMD